LIKENAKEFSIIEAHAVQLDEKAAVTRRFQPQVTCNSAGFPKVAIRE
jgi:hypothetical protein